MDAGGHTTEPGCQQYRTGHVTAYTEDQIRLEFPDDPQCLHNGSRQDDKTFYPVHQSHAFQTHAGNRGQFKIMTAQSFPVQFAPGADKHHFAACNFSLQPRGQGNPGKEMPARAASGNDYPHIPEKISRCAEETAMSRSNPLK
jgi:hypothetical protein